MTIVLVIVIGVFGGLLAGLFGVGGGILFVPTLILIGLSEHDAIGTSLLAIVPTVAAGTWRHWRYGNVRWRAALVLGLAAAAAAQGGAAVADVLADTTLRRLFAVLILLVAAQIGFRRRRGQRSVDRSIQTDAHAKPARPDGGAASGAAWRRRRP